MFNSYSFSRSESDHTDKKRNAVAAALESDLESDIEQRYE